MDIYHKEFGHIPILTRSKTSYLAEPDMTKKPFYILALSKDRNLLQFKLDLINEKIQDITNEHNFSV